MDASAVRKAEKTTRRLASQHYENFVVASVLLPRRMRQPFYNLYAFCRTADDLADESPSPAEALRRLQHFQDELNATFGGNPRSDIFVALSTTIERFDLPKQPFDDLLSAFRQDQRKTRYADFDELLDYCRRSANPVGQLVLSLAHCDTEPNCEWSAQICTGLQLANFWQDVARDFAMGRVYLPADQMKHFGVSESMLSEPTTPGELRALLASLCDHCEHYFRRGLPLAENVPSWLSSDIKLFAHGGLATLAAIRRHQYNVLRARPTVGKVQQMGLLVRAFMGRL